jgi:hypothetical protein
MPNFFKAACMPSVALRAVKVALVITPILTVFNHFQEIVELELGLGFWFQVFLTFLVPYSVSTYSSATALLGARREEGTNPLAEGQRAGR